MPPEDKATEEELAFDFYLCPEEGCNQIATLEWTHTMNSTSGGIEVGKIRCAGGHWFMQPIEGLEKV